ncbi:hypothetical protein BDV32DRAFT_127882 [Aspergillus pseudonomiae]|nr:hypothetical protein BDV32DRAFT_127882 [Aspergillus pseudonomiae]
MTFRKLSPHRRSTAQRMGKCVPEMKDIWVISSNPFGIIGALHVGIKVIWIDRSGKRWADRAAPGLEPTAIVNSLEKILHIMNDCTG